MLKANKENEKRIFLLGILFVTISYILIQCINNISSISGLVKEGILTIKPFLIAFVLSYILYPIVKLIENKFNLSRLYSVLLTYALLASFIVIGVNFVGPRIFSSLSDLIKELPQYLNQIEITLTNLIGKLNINLDLNIVDTLNKAIIDTLPYVKDFLAQSVTSAVGTTISVFSSIFNGFVTIVASVYLLLERESFLNGINLVSKKILKEKTHTALSNVIKALHLNIGKYLLGKGINSLLVAIVAFIGLTILKSNYAGLLAVLFGIMNMIPIVGPVISIIVAASLNIFSSLPKSLFIVIFLFIVQQIESFILEPRTVGKSLNLSGFSTLFSITVFGKLFGAVGMILGIPIMSLISSYLTKFFKDNTEESTEENN